MVHWTRRGFVCASWVVGYLAGEINVSFAVSVGVIASKLRDRRFCVKLSYSCHQHAYHKIDMNV